MKFHDRLVEETRREQDELLRIPFVDAAMRGALTRSQYVAFLTQAYHHVKHTVPLLMAAGSRIPSSHEWLRDAIVMHALSSIFETVRCPEPARIRAANPLLHVTRPALCSTLLAGHHVRKDHHAR